MLKHCDKKSVMLLSQDLTFLWHICHRIRKTRKLTLVPRRHAKSSLVVNLTETFSTHGSCISQLNIYTGNVPGNTGRQRLGYSFYFIIEFIFLLLHYQLNWIELNWIELNWIDSSQKTIMFSRSAKLLQLAKKSVGAAAGLQSKHNIFSKSLSTAASPNVKTIEVTFVGLNTLQDNPGAVKKVW